MIRPLERQASAVQGKRLSARALLGAFGPMGISAVMFDLQGKVDADQLQAAQVCVTVYMIHRHKSLFAWLLVCAVVRCKQCCCQPGPL